MYGSSWSVHKKAGAVRQDDTRTIRPVDAPSLGGCRLRGRTGRGLCRGLGGRIRRLARSLCRCVPVRLGCCRLGRRLHQTLGSGFIHVFVDGEGSVRVAVGLVNALAQLERDHGVRRGLVEASRGGHRESGCAKQSLEALQSFGVRGIGAKRLGFSVALDLGHEEACIDLRAQEPTLLEQASDLALGKRFCLGRRGLSRGSGGPSLGWWGLSRGSGGLSLGWWGLRTCRCGRLLTGDLQLLTREDQVRIVPDDILVEIVNLAPPAGIAEFSLGDPAERFACRDRH